MNNIVRTAFEALAAVLGGTQSLHTNSMDETLALPTEKAVTVALRTQQIIAHETGVANTIDPLAGSYFVEALTDQMERAAQAYIDKIDELGGMVAAVEAGYPAERDHPRLHGVPEAGGEGREGHRRGQPATPPKRRRTSPC